MFASQIRLLFSQGQRIGPPIVEHSGQNKKAAGSIPRLKKIRPWVSATHGLVSFMRSLSIPVRQWTAPSKAQAQKETQEKYYDEKNQPYLSHRTIHPKTKSKDI